ncbi:hypothetical protein [Kribbella endophytica]
MRGIGWKMFKDGSLTPPPLLVRYATVVFAVVTLVNLRDDHAPHEIAFAAFLCLAALGVTVGAKAMADGGADRWARAHPVLNGAAIVVLMVNCFFVLVAMAFGDRIGVLVGCPIGVVFSVYAVHREQRRLQAPAQEAARRP